MDNSQATITAYLGALRGGHTILIQDKSSRDLTENLRQTYSPDATFEQEDGLTIVSSPNPHLHPDLTLLLSTSETTGSNKAVRLTY